MGSGKFIIYTIGHSNLEPEEFMARLKNFKIELLIDVRSKPFSEYASQFNKGKIENLCQGAGMEYAFLGNLLGGKPEDDSVRLRSGEVNYRLLEQKDYFLEGIEKLLRAAREKVVCVMCSEGQPDECHRHLLIAPVLEKQGVEVWHILAEGNVIGSEQLRLELSKGQLALF